MAQASDGLLYGTTVFGGTDDLGTVYRVDLATDTLATTYSFTLVPPSGRTPQAPLTQAGDGLLYGTTFTGGEGNAGAVYRVDPASGSVTTIHSFTTTPPHGAGPTAGLVQASGRLALRHDVFRRRSLRPAPSIDSIRPVAK